MNLRFFLLLLGLFSLLAVHLIFLDKLPSIETNEAWWADIAYQYSQEGTFRSSLLDGVSTFGENFVMAPRVVLYPEALVFKYFGVGLFQARIVGLLLYIGLVAVFYTLVKEMIPHAFIRFGIFFLFLVNPLILSAAHTSRPDYMFVALAFLGAFALVRKALLHARFQYWFLLIAGFLLGLAFEAHPLIAFTSAASMGIMIGIEIFQKRLKFLSLGYFIGGGLIGVIPLVLKILGNFDAWLSQVHLLSVDFFVPLVSFWPNIGAVLAEEGLRYLNLLRWQDMTLLLFASIPFLVYAAYHTKKERSFVVLLLTYPLVLAAISSAKAETYLVPLFSLILLFWGIFLSQRFSRFGEEKKRESARVFKVAFFVSLFFLVFLSLQSIEKEIFWNQQEIFTVVKEAVGSQPEDIMIVGEFIWWFGLSDSNYRATHWLWQKEFQDDLHVGEVLLEQKPVILLVDNIWLSRYTRNNPHHRYWHAWRQGEQEELFQFTNNHCQDISAGAADALRMVVYKCP